MRILTLCILFLLTVTLAHAQDTTPEATDTGWTIEQRCVSEPTTPPDDWTFDGTILMTGYAGLHGVNDDWETPHVVAGNGVSGGALSPDGRWWATPWGNESVTETYNYITTVNEIRVYSTDDSTDIYTVPWRAVFYGGTYAQLFWQDNEHLIYSNEGTFNSIGLIRFNPFTGEQEILFSSNYPFGYSTPHGLQAHPSSDWEHITAGAFNPNGSFEWGIYQAAGEQITTDLPFEGTPFVLWHPNDSLFVAGVELESTRQLALFNSDGQQLQVIFTLSDTQWLSSLESSWSTDGRYLAFSTTTSRYYLFPKTLYIIDFVNEHILDTCTSVGYGMAWSPDRHQLAHLGYEEEGYAPVQILDMEQYQTYTVAQHFTSPHQRGSIIGWRADN